MSAPGPGIKSDIAACPFRADCVEKLENRGASKIPQMSHIGDFSHRKALQNRYERLQSFSR
jgi:hypothetical protein